MPSNIKHMLSCVSFQTSIGGEIDIYTPVLETKLISTVKFSWYGIAYILAITKLGSTGKLW